MIMQKTGLVLTVLCAMLMHLFGCSQDVDTGSIKGGKLVTVQLGSEQQDVRLEDVTSSTSITLEELVLAAWPDIDLSVLGADLVGADGFRPASKSTCRELIPVAGDLLFHGVLDVGTANLTWDEELGYSGCMQVRSLDKLILVGTDDSHVSVDVVLEQSRVGVDLRFQPTEDVDGRQMVALAGIVFASGITSSADLYLYDLESFSGSRPVRDSSATAVELEALADGFVARDDGSVFWRVLPDGDDAWNLGTVSAIHLLDRGGEPGSVQVVRGDQGVSVELGSLETVAVGGQRLVKLQDVVLAADLVSTPDKNVFDFEGTDGFRPSADKGLDPLTWEQLSKGWMHPVTGSLTWSPELSMPSAWNVSNVAKVHILDP